MGPGLADTGLVDEKEQEQPSATDQERRHRARLQPVETITLVEPGIDHRYAVPSSSMPPQSASFSNSRLIGSRGVPR